MRREHAVRSDESRRRRGADNGRCSVSTRCTPTASAGHLRASATACSNAGPFAMIDADVTIPRSCASTMPRLTASEIPKSSALTMSLSAARSSPLRERPVLHAEIMHRRESRASAAATRRAQESPARSTSSSIDRRAPDERRGVEHAELQRVHADLAFGAKCPQPVQHEAVDEARAVREHVRDGAPAARTRRAASTDTTHRTRRSSRRSWRSRRRRSAQTDAADRNQARVALNLPRAASARCRGAARAGRPRRASAASSRAPGTAAAAHLDDDAPDVLGEHGEEHEQHAEQERRDRHRRCPARHDASSTHQPTIA